MSWMNGTRARLRFLFQRQGYPRLARDDQSLAERENAIGKGSAKVVRLADASHDVFKSNEADVLREMDAFIANLP